MISNDAVTGRQPAVENAIAAAADGDPMATRWLVERYHAALLGYAGRHGSPDPEGAVDAVVTRVLDGLSPGDGPTDVGLETHLHRSLRREIDGEIDHQLGRTLPPDPPLAVTTADLDGAPSIPAPRILDSTVDDVAPTGDPRPGPTDQRDPGQAIDRQPDQDPAGAIADGPLQDRTPEPAIDGRALSRLRAALAILGPLAVLVVLVAVLATRLGGETGVTTEPVDDGPTSGAGPEPAAGSDREPVGRLSGPLSAADESAPRGVFTVGPEPTGQPDTTTASTGPSAPPTAPPDPTTTEARPTTIESTTTVSTVATTAEPTTSETAPATSTTTTAPTTTTPVETTTTTARPGDDDDD